MMLRALILWMLIAVAEMLHGVLRVALLNRRVGDRRARQIGVFTGSALILLIAFLAVPWLGLTSVADCFVIGALWLVLMLVLEVAFGRLVFHASWKRLAADFDFRQGGLLSIGMCILFLAPLLAAKWRGLI
jgi:hypothetical protein